MHHYTSFYFALPSEVEIDRLFEQLPQDGQFLMELSPAQFSEKIG